MNAIMNNRAKRTELVGALNQLITLLPTLLPNATFQVDGAQVTVEEVVANAKALLAAMTTTDTLRKQEHDATTAEAKLRATMKAEVTSVRSFIFGTLGATSTQAAALGFEPRKRAATTVPVQAAAIEKRAATRVARHTMGKKEKAAIHGTATPPAPVTPSTAK